MHRDIKPSNVLVNSRGQIKLCDFGVATETVNSIANTFVGTSTYMAPERIQGGAYSIKSDVWSVGLTIMELAIGRFPFDATDSSAGDRASAGPMGILDLLQTIVHEPAPKLPRSEAFPDILDQFIAKCLLKSPDERPTPRELYVWLSSALTFNFELTSTTGQRSLPTGCKENASRPTGVDYTNDGKEQSDIIHGSTSTPRSKTRRLTRLHIILTRNASANFSNGKPISVLHYLPTASTHDSHLGRNSPESLSTRGPGHSPKQLPLSCSALTRTPIPRNRLLRLSPPFHPVSCKSPTNIHQWLLLFPLKYPS